MWIFFALGGYALLAGEAVLSKFLITARLKSWQLYTFYIGIFSSVVIVFTPFGFEWRGPEAFFAAILSGVLFYLALAFLFQSLLVSSAVRVYVLFGAVMTLSTVFLARIFLDDKITPVALLGIGFLIVGGTLISFKHYEKSFFSNWQKTVLAGILAALSYVVLKYAYNQQNFVSGYVISRLGITAAAALSLLLPSFREKVFASLKKGKRKENIKNFFGSVAAKTVAGTGTVLIHYAIFLGSVMVVNALVATQYLLTFLLSIILSFYWKKIFIEKFTPLNVILKAVGVILVVLGTVLVS
jgi:drug/metabolite transporter (DMT)-like permease